MIGRYDFAPYLRNKILHQTDDLQYINPKIIKIFIIGQIQQKLKIIFFNKMKKTPISDLIFTHFVSQCLRQKMFF